MSIREVAAGQRLKADTVNALITGLNRLSPNEDKIQANQNRNKLLIKNTTGARVEIYNVLSIGTNYSTSNDPLDVIYNAITPDTAKPVWGILQEGVDVNKYTGEFIVAGVAGAKINVTDENHNYATLVDGELLLQSTTSETECAIIWKETGTGEKATTVLLRGGGTASTGTIQRYRLLETLTKSGSAYAVKLDFSHSTGQWTETNPAITDVIHDAFLVTGIFPPYADVIVELVNDVLVATGGLCITAET